MLCCSQSARGSGPTIFTRESQAMTSRAPTVRNIYVLYSINSGYKCWLVYVRMYCTVLYKMKSYFLILILIYFICSARHSGRIPPRDSRAGAADGVAGCARRVRSPLQNGLLCRFTLVTWPYKLFDLIWSIWFFFWFLQICFAIRGACILVECIFIALVGCFRSFWRLETLAYASNGFVQQIVFNEYKNTYFIFGGYIFVFLCFHN